MYWISRSDILEEAMVLAPGYIMRVRLIPSEVIFGIDVWGEGQNVFRIVPKLVLGVDLAEELLMGTFIPLFEELF